MKKLSAVEVAKFLNERFPHSDENWYIDSVEVVDEPNVFEQFDVVEGQYVPREPTIDASYLDEYLCWQGKGDDPSDSEGRYLLKEFKSWQKKQVSVTVTVSVPKDQVEALKAAVKGLKGKVEA